MKHRYLVTFSGKRDVYQAPLALAEVDRLEALVTDFYCPDGLVPLARRLPGVWPDRIAGRRAAGLPSAAVVTPVKLHAAHAILRTRLGLWPVATRERMAHELGRAAGRIARRRGCASLTYSYFWPGFLSGFGAEPPAGPTILFQVHPVARQVRRILSADRARRPVSVPAREEETLTEADVELYERQLRRADGIVVASTFVARGLEEAGYPPERVRVVPYGVAAAQPRSRRPREEGNGLRLLWVGQLLHRKGYHHLLDVMRDLSDTSVRLTMVCREAPDLAFMPEPPDNVRVLGEVSSRQLQELYASHDAFVMPSLVEGFGLVYLEAMAAGMPILATENTGVPDIITDGREGVIVPAGDARRLGQAIATWQADPDLVARMGRAAAAAALEFTWERFRREFCAALNSIETSLEGALLPA